MLSHALTCLSDIRCFASPTSRVLFVESSCGSWSSCSSLRNATCCQPILSSANLGITVHTCNLIADRMCRAVKTTRGRMDGRRRPCPWSNIYDVGKTSTRVAIPFPYYEGNSIWPPFSLWKGCESLASDDKYIWSVWENGHGSLVDFRWLLQRQIAHKRRIICLRRIHAVSSL